MNVLHNNLNYILCITCTKFDLILSIGIFNSKYWKRPNVGCFFQKILKHKLGTYLPNKKLIIDKMC